jgi:hypothetical protein
MMKPVIIKPKRTYFLPVQFMTVLAITFAAPEETANLPMQVPKTIIKVMEPSISPRPFCKTGEIVSIGNPKKSAAKSDVMINAINGLILNQAICRIKKIMHAVSMRMLMVCGWNSKYIKYFYTSHFFCKNCVFFAMIMLKNTCL